jgi:hypothetical protein
MIGKNGEEMVKTDRLPDDLLLSQQLAGVPKPGLQHAGACGAAA